MTVNKCSKQYQLRDKISSSASFCFAIFFFFSQSSIVEFSFPDFIFIFIFLSMFWFFFLFFFSSLAINFNLQSLLQLCLKTVSRKTKHSFSCDSCKAVFTSAKTHLAFHSIFKFHPVFRWIFKRQQTVMKRKKEEKKRFFRLRISEKTFSTSRGIFIYGQNNVCSKKRAGVSDSYFSICKAQKKMLWENAGEGSSKKKSTAAMWKTSHSHKRNINFLS